MEKLELSRRELLAWALDSQFLLEKAPKAQVTTGLCGLQAQFAKNPGYALRIRAEDFSEDSWDQGLVKIWTHRNTIHVIPQEELGLYLSAKDEHGPWQDNGWGIPAKVKPYWSQFIRARVKEGVTGREDLKDACRKDGMDEELIKRVFNGWGGLLKEMADRGLIAYTGGTEKTFLLPDEPQWMDRDEARITLLERYFTHFAPATLADCAAFFGWGTPEVKRLLKKAGLPLREAVCGGKRYWYLKEPDAPAVPNCVYLAGFDQLVMGYKDRGRFLDEGHKLFVVNQAGIAFPLILLRGRARARWKKEDRRLIITPFQPLSDRDKSSCAAAGRRLFQNRRLEVVFLPPLS